MANVQLENGYAKIANEILEQLARVPLNGTQARIIMVIWRYTYGFQQKEAELSAAYIAMALGSHQKQVERELKILLESQILKTIRSSTYTKPRVLAFNKDYDTWNLNHPNGANQLTGSKKDGELISSKTVSGLALQDHVTDDEQTVLKPFESNALEGIGVIPLTGSEIAHQKRNIYIKNNKKNNMCEIEIFFESIWKLYPQKTCKADVKKSSKERMYKIGNNRMVQCIENYKAYIEKNKDWYTPQNGGRFFNKTYVDYLDKEQPQPAKPSQERLDYLRMKEELNGKC